MATISIKVPCSSANIGPGFDVIGLALSMYLELRITTDPSNTGYAQNCKLTYEGDRADEVSLDADSNLISRTTLYVLRCHGQRSFPEGTHVHIINPIPLGRGLGSSGAAVVGGVALANVVGNLDLPKSRMLDYCLMIERHPDNVAAALYGGFVGTYLNDLNEEDLRRKEIPLSEVLPEPAGGVDTGLKPPEPPMNIGHYKKFRWAKDIKCIVIIPDFEVSTASAREVLPTTYSRADLVFNMQRVALLATALGDSPPDPDMIYEAMQDKVHQPYRKTLIPALPQILKSMTPKSTPGLLGICLSGAGPTILALATHNFETIAETILSHFSQENIKCEWKLLQPAEDGMTVTRPSTTTAPDAAMTYASAGVSIDAGNQLVQRIKAAVATTKRPGADAEIGGFGGALDLKAAGYDEAPILVQAIDGVGTKLKIAFAMNKHDTVGIDLVAMNVNDLVVQGAEPLSFLDYYACGALDVDTAASFVEGVAEGCRQSGCALVGGETAEMPGMYSEGEYDAGGQATGALRQGQKLLPDKESMMEGDILLGLASNGLHSNGFSLVRKILEKASLGYQDAAPWDQSTLVGTSLLTPTRIYVKSCLEVSNKGLVKGMAHITGGGLLENIPRMLPKTLVAEVDVSTWEVPPAMEWLRKAGNISGTEFARVWNTGIGMVLVVSTDKVEETVSVLRAAGETVATMGRLTKKSGEDCVLTKLEVWS
ncbi:phosphoribosylformylglycinamidine cyclo-ligase-like protein [Microthyrium microscopicum]|uniref:Homoserine kinase n=1 Tax=Microthyrium microscopicum TaxID=703497 RepID=A0A6A6UDC8_9PEZI|nr:phosphoribosylformylglycinamidine cyclo-ligase-like protein [Microthyrium microscopicum]